MNWGSSSTTFQDSFLGHEIVQRSDNKIRGPRSMIYHSNVSNVVTDLLANLCGHCEKGIDTHSIIETISLLLMFNSTSYLSLSHCDTTHLQPKNLGFMNKVHSQGTSHIDLQDTTTREAMVHACCDES
jgi:hypothetical protein